MTDTHQKKKKSAPKNAPKKTHQKKMHPPLRQSCLPNSGVPPTPALTSPAITRKPLKEGSIQGLLVLLRVVYGVTSETPTALVKAVFAVRPYRYYEYRNSSSLFPLVFKRRASPHNNTTPLSQHTARETPMPDTITAPMAIEHSTPTRYWYGRVLQLWHLETPAYSDDARWLSFYFAVTSFSPLMKSALQAIPRRTNIQEIWNSERHCRLCYVAWASRASSRARNGFVLRGGCRSRGFSIPG